MNAHEFPHVEKMSILGMTKLMQGVKEQKEREDNN